MQLGPAAGTLRIGDLFLHHHQFIEQALRTRDPAALRQAQANIAARRAGIRTPIGATPGSFETPGASLLRAPHGLTATPSQTPALTPLMGRYGGAIPGRGEPRDGGDAQAPADTPVMTLDRFLAAHTSEDNASFAELLEDMNARRKQAAPWLHERHTQVGCAHGGAGRDACMLSSKIQKSQYAFCSFLVYATACMLFESIRPQPRHLTFSLVFTW